MSINTLRLQIPLETLFLTPGTCGAIGYFPEEVIKIHDFLDFPFLASLFSYMCVFLVLEENGGNRIRKFGVFLIRMAVSRSRRHRSIFCFVGNRFKPRSPVSKPRNHDSFHHHHRRQEFNEIGNRNPYRGIPRNVATTNVHNRDYWWNDPLTDLTRVLRILSGEQCEQQERLIYALQSSVVTLMTDQRMYSIFQAFLEACEEGRHFGLLVETIALDQESFLNAAFCKQGLYSITKLIRKLKRSPHASTVTTILSTRFLDLMTDSTASKVVHECFVLFRYETNEILYEKTIRHCQYLAIHKVGCRSLNDCISTISGEQRSRLLDKIADMADVLCDDPYGNYVLQDVMRVNHGNVNAKIFDCLRGKFVELAQRQAGSKIVEKCMEISVTCMMSVVKEILKSPRAPLVLADHTYGNYVVQRALRMTKEHELTDLYNALVNSLRPHFITLVKAPFGRRVMNVINSLA